MSSNVTAVENQYAIVGAIVRGMRRRGLPASVEPEDLRQIGIAALLAVPEEKRPNAKTVATIARNAITDVLRSRFKQLRHFRSSSDLDRDGVRTISTDPIFLLEVGDAADGVRHTPSTGLLRRHSDWEAERAARWADIRGTENLCE